MGATFRTIGVPGCSWGDRRDTDRERAGSSHDFDRLRFLALLTLSTSFRKSPQMSGRCVFLGSQMALVVGVGHAELRVGFEPIVTEIEAVFNEQRPRKGVVPDAVAVNPRIRERQREQKDGERIFLAPAQPRMGIGLSRTGRVESQA
jgi:hypothetical protein